MNDQLSLELSTVNIYELIDHATLAAYMSGENGEEQILSENRMYYPNSKELKIQGVYFALTTFPESDGDFTVLSFYKKVPRQKKTYRYSFGAFDPKQNTLYWFFSAQPKAESRDIAIKLYRLLQTWCSKNFPDYIPFAYKK